MQRHLLSLEGRVGNAESAIDILSCQESHFRGTEILQSIEQMVAQLTDVRQRAQQKQKITGFRMTLDELDRKINSKSEFIGQIQLNFNDDD